MRCFSTVIYRHTEASGEMTKATDWQGQGFRNQDNNMYDSQNGEMVDCNERKGWGELQSERHVLSVSTLTTWAKELWPFATCIQPTSADIANQ
jgi:hypothetical protein